MFEDVGQVFEDVGWVDRCLRMLDRCLRMLDRCLRMLDRCLRGIFFFRDYFFYFGRGDFGRGDFGRGDFWDYFFFWERGFWERGFWIIFFLGEGMFCLGFLGLFFFLGEGMFCLGILISERVKDWGRWSVFSSRKVGEGDLKLCWLPTKLTGGCGWRGYEREEKEGEREVDNLSTWGCVIQLYLQENTQFIKIREFGWGFLMLTS